MADIRYSEPKDDYNLSFLQNYHGQFEIPKMSPDGQSEVRYVIPSEIQHK